MSVQKPLQCVVMGSFRFKKQIDLAIEELRDNHVSVLGPDPGGLFKSDFQGFWPLASERHIPPAAVEDRFLSQICRSDFVYIVNPDGYVGSIVSLEMGFCIARETPIYSRESIDKKLDLDPIWAERIDKYIKVETIPSVIDIETKNKLERDEGKLHIATLDDKEIFPRLTLFGRR